MEEPKYILRANEAVLMPIKQNTALKFFNREKKEYFPSPMELQFFEDRLVLYLPKRYYSERITRMEYIVMYYSEISKCSYKTLSKRIHIYGNGTSFLFNYKKDGTVPNIPTKTIEFTEGLIYFNTSLAQNIDFKAEIESHSPLKVIVENN